MLCVCALMRPQCNWNAAAKRLLWARSSRWWTVVSRTVAETRTQSIHKIKTIVRTEDGWREISTE